VTLLIVRIVAVGIVINCAIYLYIYIEYGKVLYFSHLSKNVSTFILSWTYFLPIVLTLLLFAISIWKPFSHSLLLILSLSLIFCDGSSGGIDWYGAAIPLVYLTGLVLEKYLQFAFFDPLILICSCLFVVGVVTSWADNTYNWWGLNSGASYNAKATINIGLAKGLKVNNGDVGTYEAVNSKIRSFGSCRERMLAFPSIPYFILSNNGKSVDSSNAQYWFDFISQSNVRKAISSLQKSPPDVYVSLNLPEFVWQGHSKAFNGGEEYAQRDFVSFGDDLVAHNYKKFTYLLSSSPGYSVSIFANPRCVKP